MQLFEKNIFGAQSYGTAEELNKIVKKNQPIGNMHQLMASSWKILNSTSVTFILKKCPKNCKREFNGADTKHTVETYSQILKGKRSGKIAY